MAALSGTAALGCGDKLLAVGRGVRFQRAYAAHQANLVIYSAGAQGGAALTNAKLQATLRRVVHNVQVARDGAQLDAALKSGQVDVVLIDSADLTGVTRQLQSATSKLVILPADLHARTIGTVALHSFEMPELDRKALRCS